MGTKLHTALGSHEFWQNIQLGRQKRSLFAFIKRKSALGISLLPVTSDTWKFRFHGSPNNSVKQRWAQAMFFVHFLRYLR